jgi:hypothetical protein
MPNPDDQLMQKFKDAREQFRKLKAEYNIGEITRDELQARMKELMVLDNENNWWSIGIETIAWHKFVDGDWELMPLPVSIPEEETIAKSVAEKPQPGLIDDRSLYFKFPTTKE